MADLDHLLIHGSLGQPKSLSQTEFQSVQPFLQSSHKRDQQTEHDTPSLAIDCCH